MSLSEQEQRALREIEMSLMAEDPEFGAAVAGELSSGRPGGLTLRGIALVVVGLVMLVGGVALAQRSLWFVVFSILGFLVMFAASVWMLRGGSARFNARERTPRAAKAKKDDGVGSRLEDNFRRRFEN